MQQFRGCAFPRRQIYRLVFWAVGLASTAPSQSGLCDVRLDSLVSPIRASGASEGIPGPLPGYSLAICGRALQPWSELSGDGRKTLACTQPVSMPASCSAEPGLYCGAAEGVSGAGGFRSAGMNLAVEAWTRFDIGVTGAPADPDLSFGLPSSLGFSRQERVVLTLDKVSRQLATRAYIGTSQPGSVPVARALTVLLDISTSMSRIKAHQATDTDGWAIPTACALLRAAMLNEASIGGAEQNHSELILYAGGTWPVPEVASWMRDGAKPCERLLRDRVRRVRRAQRRLQRGGKSPRRRIDESDALRSLRESFGSGPGRELRPGQTIVAILSDGDFCPSRTTLPTESAISDEGKPVPCRQSCEDSAKQLRGCRRHRLTVLPGTADECASCLARLAVDQAHGLSSNAGFGECPSPEVGPVVLVPVTREEVNQRLWRDLSSLTGGKWFILDREGLPTATKTAALESAAAFARALLRPHKRLVDALSLRESGREYAEAGITGTSGRSAPPELILDPAVLLGASQGPGSTLCLKGWRGPDDAKRGVEIQQERDDDDCLRLASSREPIVLRAKRQFGDGRITVLSDPLSGAEDRPTKAVVGLEVAPGVVRPGIGRLSGVESAAWPVGTRLQLVVPPAPRVLGHHFTASVDPWTLNVIKADQLRPSSGNDQTLPVGSLGTSLWWTSVAPVFQAQIRGTTEQGVPSAAKLGTRPAASPDVLLLVDERVLLTRGWGWPWFLVLLLWLYVGASRWFHWRGVPDRDRSRASGGEFLKGPWISRAVDLLFTTGPYLAASLVTLFVTASWAAAAAAFAFGTASHAWSPLGPSATSHHADRLRDIRIVGVPTLVVLSLTLYLAALQGLMALEFTELAASLLDLVVRHPEKIRQLASAGTSG